MNPQGKHKEITFDSPVEELLKVKESEIFDRTTGGQENIGKKIAGFGTKNGGLLLVGQRDLSEGGEVEGIDEVQFQSDFSHAIDNVKPAPLTRSRILAYQDKKLALIQVQDVGALRPCAYGRAYYERKGDSTLPLQPEEVRRYHLAYGSTNVEELPTHASTTDMDEAELEQYSQLLKKEKEKILETVTTKEGNLTVRGVVVLCKNPQKYLEGDFIEVQRYDNVIGSPPSPIGTPIKLSKPARQLIEETALLVAQNLPVERIYEGARMIESPAIPSSVIREVITNAVAHRNYRSNEHIRIRIFADCFDVTNPAIVSEKMWASLLTTHTTYHPNEGIYTFLNPTQLYEGRGEGIWKIREELERLRKAAPEFKVIGDVPSTFYAKINLAPAKTKDVKMAKLHTLLLKHKEITSSHVMKQLNISRVTAISMLNRLVEQGVLDHSGHTKTSKYVVKNPQLLNFEHNK